jgi:hypothetical protein
MLAGVFQFLFQPSVATLELIGSLNEQSRAQGLAGSVGIQIRARGLSYNDDGVAMRSFEEVDAFLECATRLIKMRLPANESAQIALQVACDNPNALPRLDAALATAGLTSRVVVVRPDADAVSGSGFRRSATADRHAVADIIRVARSDVVLITSHSSYGSMIGGLHPDVSTRYTAGDGKSCALFPNTDSSCLHAAGTFLPKDFDRLVVQGGCFANATEFESAFKLELDVMRGWSGTGLGLYGKLGIECR